MGSIRQRIRFCEAPDGVRIAYSVIGRGPPLVMLSGGHCHLELDLASPVLGHWFSELSRRHSLVRLDTRGFGLSRSEEHTSELQSLRHLVCRLLLEKKKKQRSLLGIANRSGAEPSIAS